MHQRRHVRWQGLMVKQGNTWTPKSVGPAPFPHSGLPDLLVTHEGVVLHVTEPGVHWTADAGKTWHSLGLPRMAYYPKSLQLADGRVLVFGHLGGQGVPSSRCRYGGTKPASLPTASNTSLDGASFWNTFPSHVLCSFAQCRRNSGSPQP